MENLSSKPSFFIWNFLKYYKWKVFFICLAIFFDAFLIIIGPYLLKVLIDKMSAYRDNFSLFEEGQDLIIIICLFIILSVFANLIWRSINYLSIKIFPEIRLITLSKTFSYIFLHSYQYFQDHMSGDLTNKIQNIGESIERIFMPTLSILHIFFTILVATFISYSINIYFSIVLVIWVGIFIFISITLSKNIISYSKDFSQAKSIASGKYIDSLMNIFNVNIFVRYKFEKSYLEKISRKVMNKDIALRWKLLKLWIIQGILCSFVLGAMTFILILLRSKNLVTTGDFVFIISTTIAIIHYIFEIAELISRVVDETSILNQAISTIYIPHSIMNINSGPILKVKNPEISFENVSFSYTPNTFILNNFNITIPANQKIAVVGHSGSGKTTFVNLLIRLFDIQKGIIKIDHKNISDFSISSLRENISLIPQNPMLFHRSFMENIRYGRLSATNKEVIAAAKKSYAHEFIMQSSEGYDSLIGENGIKLSGGQRQKLAIARAILKNAPILILDEATSSLDPINEALIQDSLKKLMHNKTVIIITHKLSTLMKVDRILVFNNGEIVEDGTHNMLLAKRKLYSKLWSYQKGKENVE